MDTTIDLSSLLSAQALTVEAPVLRDITLKVAAVSGINLGQGVCQLPVPDVVKQAAYRAIENGINRYTPPRGLLSTRQAIANKLQQHNNLVVDPEKEIIITCGSTGAFEGVCATLINSGDEAVLFSPYYPYHRNTLKRFGANVRYVEMKYSDKTLEWTFDQNELKSVVSEKTKFVVVNTPGNPTGKVFTREELEIIGRICEPYNCLVVTDEIYEYMLYDGAKHISPATIDSLKDRTITIGGYSKTFAITGWRIGYLVLPDTLADAMTPLLDSIYICPPAPLQQAVGDAVNELSGEFYCKLAGDYRAKRERCMEALSAAGLKPYHISGSYYIMGGFAANFPNYSGAEFADHMIKTTKIGAVPSSDFVDNPDQHKWLRFCFAVPDEVLEQAAVQLKQLA